MVENQAGYFISLYFGESFNNINILYQVPLLEKKNEVAHRVLPCPRFYVYIIYLLSAGKGPDMTVLSLGSDTTWSATFSWRYSNTL